MTDDTSTRLTACLSASGVLALDALMRFREGRADEYAELKRGFDEGRVTLGVDVVLLPQPGVEVWARETGGQRQVLVTIPAAATMTGSLLPN